MAKILIVEDDHLNRRLFRIILESKGYEIIEATNGQEGIEFALQNKPDLIFMDIQMPVMDGLEAIKQLKSHEETRVIPTIALTAFALKGDQERIREGGFDDYLSKPADMDTLLGVARKYLPA